MFVFVFFSGPPLCVFQIREDELPSYACIILTYYPVSHGLVWSAIRDLISEFSHGQRLDVPPL